MRHGARSRRGLRTLLLLAVTATAPVLTSALTPQPAAAAPAAGEVRMRIDDVTPSTPVPSTSARPLRVQVTLTNTTGTALTSVAIRGFRGDPIGTQAALDRALGDSTPPTDGLAIATAKPLTVDLAANGSVTTTFVTSTSILDDGRLCLCDTQIYPIHLTASSRGGTLLGSATTYLPSLKDEVDPVKVSWVWPLIDRPHRLTDDTVFLDDALAASVNGGRMDRALQVIERVAEDDPTLPITLMVDPEMLDELAVMAQGQYRVSTTAAGRSTTVLGTGQDAAQAWLDRFGALVEDDTALQVAFTPYADPDIDSLAQNDLSWRTALPSTMATRVATTLRGRTAMTDLAWPAGGTVGTGALDTMAGAGVTTVVLDAASVTPSSEAGIPVSVTRLRSSVGAVTGAITSPAVQRGVAAAVSPDSGSGAALPVLVSEIAVRAVQSRSAASHAVLTPPRYVDPSVDRAVRTIEDTSRSPFATPVAVRSLGADRPSKATRLRTRGAGGDLSTTTLDTVRTTSRALPAINALLALDPDARTLLAGLPRAVQRISSAAWRVATDNPFGNELGPELARTLGGRVEALLSGVRIVRPSSGSYTLGSENSKLPITVENTLPYTVQVRVSVQAQAGLPGYSTDPVGVQRIAANTKQTVQIPSRLDRSGRIPVEAQLSTPNDARLGPPVELSVRSTAFGVIGIVITFGAGGILVLALVVRFARRLKRLRRKSAAQARAQERAVSASSGAGATP